MGLQLPHAVGLVLVALFPALVVSCGGRVAEDTGDGPTDGGTDTKAVDTATKPPVALDCQASCAANHPDAFADFVRRWLWRGCEGAGCRKDCAATLCDEPPEYPTAACTDCLLYSSSDFIVGDCVADEVCAPVVSCWLLCPGEAN